MLHICNFMCVNSQVASLNTIYIREIFDHKICSISYKGSEVFPKNTRNGRWGWQIVVLLESRKLRIIVSNQNGKEPKIFLSSYTVHNKTQTENLSRNAKSLSTHNNVKDINKEK